jgi:hypothetical protein
MRKRSPIRFVQQAEVFARLRVGVAHEDEVRLRQVGRQQRRTLREDRVDTVIDHFDALGLDAEHVDDLCLREM